MLYMVIERFRGGDVKAIGERFQRQGRMLPEDVVYRASWVDAARGRCFQLMEAPRIELMDEWTRRWTDLIEFEIVPVQTSADFWASQNATGS